MLDTLCTDVVFVIKRDGRRVGPYSAVVDRNEITVPNTKMDVEDGDLIEREMPNGRNEQYEVLEATLHQHPVLGSWSLSVRKSTSKLPDPRDRAPRINVTNSAGVQIGDNNQQTIALAFEQLIRDIDNADANDHVRRDAKQKLKDFLAHPLVGSIMGSVASAIAAKL